MSAHSPAPPTILHVITRLLRGGSERRLVDAVRATPDLHHVVVAGEVADGVTAPGDAELVVLPHLVRSPSPRRDVGAIHALTRLMARRQPQVVHTHQAKAHMLGRVARTRTDRDVPVVVSLSMSPSSERLGRLWWGAERLLAGDHDVVAAVGVELRDEYVQRVGTASVEVIRSSLDLAPFHAAGTLGRRDAARTRLGVDADALVLCHVGSLDDRKRPDRLLPLARQVQGMAGRGVHVLFAGDGPMRPQLTDAFDAAGMAATFLGHVDTVADVMGASDCLVLASRSEGLPQVLVQAAATGLPVAAAPTTGVREAMARNPSGSAVLTLRPDGSDARAVLALCDAPHTPARPTTFDEWDPAHVGEQYRRLYARLLSGRTAAVTSGADPVPAHDVA